MCTKLNEINKSTKTMLTLIFLFLLECPITSISSPSASSLLVRWNSYDGATNFFLDLRVVDVSNVAPVVVSVPRSSTKRRVQGLWPGTTYKVTLKVFQFYRVLCQATETFTTGTLFYSSYHFSPEEHFK